MTALGCERVFAEAFVGGAVEARAYGNVLTAVAFLMGMAAEELSTQELNVVDPFFPVLVTLKAKKTV